MVESGLRMVAVVASLVGLVWLWVTMDMGDMMLAKVIVVGVMWAVWLAIVMGAVALLALFLGMLGFITGRK